MASRACGLNCSATAAACGHACSQRKLRCHTHWMTPLPSAGVSSTKITGWEIAQTHRSVAPRSPNHFRALEHPKPRRVKTFRAVQEVVGSVALPTFQVRCKTGILPLCKQPTYSVQLRFSQLQAKSYQ